MAAQTRLIWRNLSLPQNTTWTIQIEVRIKSAYENMTNQAMVWSTKIDGTMYIEWWPNGETNANNNTDSASLTTAPFDLSISKQIIYKNWSPYNGTDTFNSGDTITYRLTYYNSWYARDDISIVDTHTAFLLRYLTSTIAPTNLQPDGVLQSMQWFPTYVTPSVWWISPFWNNLSLWANSTWNIDITFAFNDICNSFLENSAWISLTSDEHFMPWTSNPGTNTGMLTLVSNPNWWPNTLEVTTSNNQWYVWWNIYDPSWSPWCSPTIYTWFDLVFWEKTYDDSDGYVFPWQEIEYTITYYNDWPTHNHIYLWDNFPSWLQYVGIVSTWQFTKAEDSPVRDYRMWDFLNSQIDRAISEAMEVASNPDYLSNIPTIPYNLTQTYYSPLSFDTYLTWRIEYYCIKNNPDLNSATVLSLDYFRDNYISKYNDYYSWWNGIYDKRDAFRYAWAETTLIYMIMKYQTDQYPI